MTDADSTVLNSAIIRRRRTLIALFAVHFFGSVVASIVGHIYGLEFVVIVLAGLSLCASQAALLGTWFGFGRWKSPRRVLACALTLLVISGVLVFGVYSQRSFNSTIVVILSGLIVGTFAAVTLATLVMKRTGLALGLLSETSATGTRARLQFTMVDLFAMTTVVAILTVAVSALRRFLGSATERDFDTVAALAIGVTVTIPPLMAAALSSLRWQWRLLAATSIGLIALPLYFPFKSWWGPILLVAIAGITLASLLVVRWAGYRLYVGQRNQLAPSASTDSAT